MCIRDSYNALPAPKAEVKVAGDNEGDQDGAAPQTPAELFLAGVWSEVLETDQIDLNDNFFDIGGHSLLVMRVIAAVKEETGYALGPQDFLIGTLEQLADKFSDQFSAVAETADATEDTIPASAQVAEVAEAQSPVESPAQTSSSGFAASKSEEKSTPAPETDGASVETRILKTLKGFWKG